MKFDRSALITLVVLLAIIVLLALVVWWVINRMHATALKESAAGTALVPEVEQAAYTDLAGNELSLDQYIGSVLIVHSWASWCPHCASDLQTLEELTTQYSADDVVVLAINRAEPAVTAQRYIQRTLNDAQSVQLVLDPADSFYTSLAGYAMPETIIFNSSGEEVIRFRTALELAVLTPTIDELLTGS